MSKIGTNPGDSALLESSMVYLRFGLPRIYAFIYSIGAGLNPIIGTAPVPLLDFYEAGISYLAYK